MPHTTQHKRALPEDRLPIPLPRFNQIVDVPDAPRPKLESAVQGIPELPVVEKKSTPSAEDIGRIFGSDPDKKLSAIPDRVDTSVSPIKKQAATPTDLRAGAQGKSRLVEWWDGLDPANKKAINRALLTTGLSLLAQSGEVSRYPISTAGQFGKAALHGVAAYDQSLAVSAKTAADAKKDQRDQARLALERQRVQVMQQRYQLEVEKELHKQDIDMMDRATGLPERKVPNQYLEGAIPAQGPHVEAGADRTLPGLDFQGDAGIPAPQTAEEARANKAFPSTLDTKTVTRKAVPKGKKVLEREHTEEKIKLTKAQTELARERKKYVGTKAAKKGPSELEQARTAYRLGTATEQQRKLINKGRTKFVNDYISIYRGTVFTPKKRDNLRKQGDVLYDVEELGVNPFKDKDIRSASEAVQYLEDIGFSESKARAIAKKILERQRRGGNP